VCSYAAQTQRAIRGKDNGRQNVQLGLVQASAGTGDPTAMTTCATRLVIVMTDADVDGAPSIASLSTFFYSQRPT